MGLGLQTLSQAFPKLIHCRVSASGADGPLGGLPGYDACAQAMCGLMSVNGEADGEATRRPARGGYGHRPERGRGVVLLALNERDAAAWGS